MVIIEELQSISTALVRFPIIAELIDCREAKAMDEAINNIIKRLDAVITAINLDAAANDLRLLDELRTVAKKKHEIWEKDSVGFGLSWRSDVSAVEYRNLEDRIADIMIELFGENAIEI